MADSEEASFQRTVTSDLRQREGPSRQPGPAPGFFLPEATRTVTQLIKMKINGDERGSLFGGILVASAGVLRF